MSKERIWTRIYVDRMKLTSLSGYMSRGRKKDELGVKGWLTGPKPEKFDMERIFAKLPKDDVISDTSIDELIDEISSLKKHEAVGSITNRLLQARTASSSTGTPKGELVLLEAASPVEEGLSLPRPDGRTIPLLRKGSYLGYRKPFEKLLLFDGTYHSGILFDFVDLSSYDILKTYLKEGDDIAPGELLGSWDNFHARIVGLLGACPPYQCRFRTTGNQDPEWKISFGLFALVIDVSPLDNLDVAQRMSFWRNV